jgi:guanine nucleotide-binding protein alpha-1 subunit
VVYHNIARAVAVVLAVLEAHDDDYYDPSTGPRDASPPRPSSIRPPMIHPQRTSTQNTIANLRLRLSPLVAAERLLAERLSGGLPRPSPVIGADGRRPAENEVLFVKAGWKRRAESSSPTPTGLVGASAGALSPTGRFGTGRDELLENVAAILAGSREDIVTLWELPMVRRLVERRRLRFDEWAE